MPEPGRPGAPIFGRSVNPITTGEGRLSPPITTGAPPFFSPSGITACVVEYKLYNYKVVAKVVVSFKIVL